MEKEKDKHKTDRKTENKASEWIKWMIWTVLHWLLSKEIKVAPFIKLFWSCNPFFLKRWLWKYKNYFFAWNQSHIAFFDKWTLDIFKTPNFISSILNRLNWLKFNADEKAKNNMNNFVENMIDNVYITDSSYINFKNALEKAKQEWRKIIILWNHASHMDAPIYQYLFDKIVLPKTKSKFNTRFLCWAFMYYSKIVRAYNICFNTMFVMWPADIVEMTKYWRSQWKPFIESIRKLKNKILEWVKSDKDEILIIYPYAWRSTNPNWCKDKIENWMEEMLSSEDCIYIPVAIHWTSTMLWIQTEWIFKWSKILRKANIRCDIWNYFVWWKKTLDEINQLMQENANIWL